MRLIADQPSGPDETCRRNDQLTPTQISNHRNVNQKIIMPCWSIQMKTRFCQLLSIYSMLRWCLLCSYVRGALVRWDHRNSVQGYHTRSLLQHPISPLSVPLITRVTFEGSCCHIRSALTLRTVVFTSIQSVFPGTSTHWFWMQHKESRTSLLLCMKVLHSLDYNNQSIPKSSLA